MKLTCIVNTFNEEKNIYNCLSSIDWVDELVLVDMYSTDKTIEIAKKFTTNIYFHSYTGYVEKARNFAINKAKGKWVLILDADEELDKKAEIIIRKLILNKELDGYLFPRRNYVSGDYYLKYGYFYPDYQLRLFRNNRSIYYSGKIHQQAKIINKTLIIKNIEIIHNNSHSKYSSFMAFKNFIPYIKIEGEDLLNQKLPVYNMLGKGLIIFFKHIYRSYIKLKGYKDGYFGFRAAILYAIYKASVYYYASVLSISSKYE